MINEYEYEQAINAQWIKLAHAESNEELREVLSTWPDPKDYEIKEEEKKEEKDD